MSTYAKMRRRQRRSAPFGSLANIEATLRRILPPRVVAEHHARIWRVWRRYLTA